jgi:hypothetical protein
LGDNETGIAPILYNDPVMETIGAENIIIGVLAGIGVLVLLVVFAYVVRQVLKKES